MRKIVVFLLCVVAVYYASAQITEIPKKEIPADYGYIVKIGQQLPAFEMQLPDGTQIATSDFKGKVVMLQFTASWCPVCRKEMPHIEKEIWQKHKNNPDFVLYGIDLKEDAATTAKFRKDLKITYPLALDPLGKIFYTFAVQNAGVTRNIIIDKNGKIVYMTRLYKKEEFQEMKKVIELLLEHSVDSNKH